MYYSDCGTSMQNIILDTLNQMFIEGKDLIFDILEHFGWLVLVVPKLNK